MKLVICKLFVFLHVLLCVNFCYSQDWKWAKSGGSSSNDEGGGVTVDKTHNVYSAGVFTNTFTASTTSLTSKGGQDILLTKYDSSGNFVWAVQAGSGGDDWGNCVCVDDSANVYLTGLVSGTDTAVFDTDTLFGLGGLYDGFLAKYDSSGQLVWVIHMGGSSNDGASPVKVDMAGNIVIGGSFSDTSSFGNFISISAGKTDGFLAKCTPAGNMIWLRTGGGAEAECFYGISIDANNDILSAGFFQQSATFSSLVITSTAFINETAFIAKYSSAGSIQWIKQAGGGGPAFAYSTSVDAANNYYVAGQFKGIANFDTTTITSAGVEDIFIAKYDANGNRKWTKKIGGTGFDACFGSATDQLANTYITGYFSSSGTPLGQPKGSTDIYIAKYDSSGNFIWSGTAGGTGLEYSYGLTLDYPNDIYVSAMFSGNCFFDTDSITSAGGRDFCIAKMRDTSALLSSVKEAYDSPFTMKVYPNPFHENIIVSVNGLSNEQFYISVVNVLGQEIASSKTEANYSQIKILLPNISAGIYFLKARTEKQLVGEMILIKDR